MKLIKAFIFSFSCSLVAIGAATAADTVPEAHPSVVIEFGAGSSKLADSDKAALRAAVRDVLQKHPVRHVTVAAWSDKQLPAQGQKLGDTDRGLARERAAVINEFLKSEMEISDVDTFNMAENANWLARTFNTKDAELKSVFTRAEGSPVKKAEFRTIRAKGGPSHAVVVVVRDLD